MTITVKIKTDTPTGKKLANELRQYPEVVKIAYSLPVDSLGNEIETIPVAESAVLAFEKLGENYKCRFENKYTR